jgi:hypothetical protein
MTDSNFALDAGQTRAEESAEILGLHIVPFAACLNYPPLDGSSFTASESFRMGVVKVTAVRRLVGHTPSFK